MARSEAPLPLLLRLLPQRLFSKMTAGWTATRQKFANPFSSFRSPLQTWNRGPHGKTLCLVTVAQLETKWSASTGCHHLIK